MAEYQNVIVFFVASLAAIATAWGFIRGEVANIKSTHAAEIVEIKASHNAYRSDLTELKREVSRDLVGKEHCREIHARGTKDYDEMKGDLKKINEKLDVLLMRSGA